MGYVREVHYFAPDVGICEDGVIGILYIRSVLQLYHLYYVICVTYGLSLRLSSYQCGVYYCHSFANVRLKSVIVNNVQPTKIC